MAAVFALAPAFKAAGALGLGSLGLSAHQALKNVNLPGARPNVTADIFPPSRVKLGDSHRLEVIAAPENPSNALATTPSEPPAKKATLTPTSSEQPNGGGGKPPPDWNMLSAGFSGGLVGLDKYLDATDPRKRTWTGMIGSTMLGGAVGVAFGSRELWGNPAGIMAAAGATYGGLLYGMSERAQRLADDSFTGFMYAGFEGGIVAIGSGLLAAAASSHPIGMLGAGGALILLD